MKFTRRKAIASIGLAAAGAGGAFGTGAFSRTEADREFDLQIAADDSALLTLEPNSDAPSEATEVSNDLLAFDFDDFGNADGINAQGDTAFRELFTITNNTSQPLWVWLSVNETSPDDINSEKEAWAEIYDSGTRSVEFVAHDDGTQSSFSGSDNDGTRPRPRGRDLSFPAGLHKDYSQDGDAPSNPGGSGSAEQSRAFGMTPGGAVELGSGQSVDVDVNFLVLGATVQDYPESSVRLIADRQQPDENGFPSDPRDTDWFANYFDA